jgi:hypothetical protein
VADRYPDDSPASAWPTLGPVEQAREWEEFRPGTFEQVFEQARREAKLRREFMESAAKHEREFMEIEAKHERRLDYIAVSIQILTLFFALGAVVVMALTAKYYADHGAASDGVKIFGFGAASIVAAFLGVNAAPVIGRLRARKVRKRLND